jgi:hypothetical protein
LCPTPREPATSGAAQGDSGSFGTLEAVCYFVQAPMPTCGGPLPEKVDGGYYFDFGPSMSIDYTSFYWYTS